MRCNIAAKRRRPTSTRTTCQHRGRNTVWMVWCCSRNGTWQKLSIKNKQTKINMQCFQLHDVPNRALRFATADSALAVLRTEPEAAAVPVVLLGTCLVDLVAVASRGRWPVTAAPAPAVAVRRLLWRLLAPSSFAHRFMRCAYDASLCSSAWMRR